MSRSREVSANGAGRPVFRCEVTELPFAARAGVITRDGMVIGVETMISCVHPDGTVVSSRDFPTAQRGMRCIFRDSRRRLFASPEGKRLRDEEKGIWRSSDAGSTWERVLSLSGHENPVSVWSIVEDAVGRLFAGVYGLGNDRLGAMIFRSNDGGEAWSQCFHDPLARHVHALAVDEWTGAVFASIGDGFWPWRAHYVVQTADAGATWRRLAYDLPQIVPIVVTPHALILGSDDPDVTAVYRIADGRATMVYECAESEYFFWARRDPERGFIIAGTVAASPRSPRASIIASHDDGLHWSVVQELPVRRAYDGFEAATAVSDGACVVSTRLDGVQGLAIRVRLFRD